MKKIELTRGQFALVADEHYEDLLRRHAWEKIKKPTKWCAGWNSCTKSFYAIRKVGPRGQQTTEWMHRRILGLQHGDKRDGDHVNHDTLDNQPTNLRIVTHRQNHENRQDQSKYGVGVTYRTRRKSRPFEAYAYFDGKQRHIGYFATAEEAQIARRYWLAKHL